MSAGVVRSRSMIERALCWPKIRRSTLRTSDSSTFANLPFAPWMEVVPVTRARASA
jgi:hypothetical protein